MNSKDFMLALKAAVIDENIDIYKDLFNGAHSEYLADEYWRRALGFYNSLNREQQNIFFEVIRQVMIDTTSNILGVLDGTCTIKGMRDDFILIYGKNSDPLTGDLQSLFLECEENRS